MDDERYDILYRLVTESSPRRGKRCQSSDGDILLILLWAAPRQNPICWACDPRNAPRRWCDRTLPSPSRVNRRLRREALATPLDRVTSHLQQRLLVAVTLIGCCRIHAKPLVALMAEK